MVRGEVRREIIRLKVVQKAAPVGVITGSRSDFGAMLSEVAVEHFQKQLAKIFAGHRS